MMANLNFHQTFPPTLDYLVRLMKLCPMTEEMNKEEISEITGIPTGKSSGKVVPHIEYGVYMGLFQNISGSKGKYKLSLTSVGNLISMEDCNLKEQITQWLLHVHMCRPTDGACQWSAFFREIMPKYRESISMNVVLDEYQKLIVEFNQSTKLGPFFSTYLTSLPELKLIEKKENNIFLNKLSSNSEYLYLYAFAILVIWDEVYPNRIEITKDNFDSLETRNIFCMEHNDWNGVVQLLVDKGIFKINAQINPVTVIRNQDQETVLSKIYSLLL